MKRLPRMPTTDVCTYKLLKNEFAKFINSDGARIFLLGVLRGGLTVQRGC